MLRRRVVVCLDVDHGRVVKGVSFRDLRDVGDPVELARRYEAEGADEIVYLDISASTEGRQTLFDVVKRTAERLFIPLTVGGGINSVEDMDRALRAGADKVSVNTAAVHRPALLGEAAARFGKQCVVLSIDAARTDGGDRFDVFTHGGRTASGLDAVEWARTGVAAGAGEILITSIDRDGRRDGYDIPLTRSIVEAVAIPVIASGGAGEAAHLREAFIEGGADAALAAGMFHDGTTTVTAVKAFLSSAGVPVRTPTGGTV
jgi:cyclase